MQVKGDKHFLIYAKCVASKQFNLATRSLAVVIEMSALEHVMLSIRCLLYTAYFTMLTLKCLLYNAYFTMLPLLCLHERMGNSRGKT